MFDGTEDVKVSESTDDGEEDDCFYGGVCGMKRKRAEKSTHLGVQRMAAAVENNNFKCRTTLITPPKDPRPPLAVRMGLVIAAAQTIDRLKH